MTREQADSLLALNPSNVVKMFKVRLGGWGQIYLLTIHLNMVKRYPIKYFHKKNNILSNTIHVLTAQTYAPLSSFAPPPPEKQHLHNVFYQSFNNAVMVGWISNPSSFP